jgi:antitoxin HicB
MYPVILEPDDNGSFLVTCPDLPEVTSWGEDVADALRHAADAIEEALAARMAHGDPIPIPFLRRKGPEAT